MAISGWASLRLFSQWIEGTKWASFSREEQSAIIGFLGLPAQPSWEQVLEAAKERARDLDIYVGEWSRDTSGGGDGDIEIDPPGGGDGKIKEQERRAKRQGLRNLEHSFLTQVQSYGMAINGNIRSLIDEAVTKKYTQYTFLYFLRQTPEYRQTFPGIFDKKGVLQMSEDQYISYKSQFEGIAAQWGLSASPAKIATLFRKDITPEEFQIKAEGISRLKRDPQLFRQFQASLRRDGITSKDLTRKELYRFVLNEGNQEWYDHWNEAVARNAAVDAGLKIKQKVTADSAYASVRANVIEKLSKQGLSEEEITAGLSQVADDFTELIPLAAAQSNNIRRKDIMRATFGGPRASIARQKIDRIRGQEEAFYEDRAGAGEEISPTGSSQRSGYQQRAQGA